MRHFLLTTELTRMKNDKCCVAAWDLTASRMVRPLKKDGEYWDYSHERAIFLPGSLVECDPLDGEFGNYPHKTENLLVQSQPKEICRFIECEVYPLLIQHCLTSILDCFGRSLEDNKYIIGGTQCPSIGSVRTKRENLHFSVDKHEMLRLQFTDTDSRKYDLPVTCDLLNFYFSKSNGRYENFGLSEANEWLSTIPAEEEVILRIGLARAWAGKDKTWNPERCYVQLNGIVTRANYYYIFAGPPSE